MKTIQAQVPDYLATLAADAAAREHISIDQVVALALSAQLSAWKVREDIETRAKRGNPEHLREILDQVPDVPPPPGDEK